MPKIDLKKENKELYNPSKKGCFPGKSSRNEIFND